MSFRVWVTDPAESFEAEQLGPTRWNGFDDPWFTTAQAQAIAESTVAMREKYGEDSDLVAYSADADLFTIERYGEVETVPFQDVDGIRLHNVGGWIWTWQELEED